MHELGVLAYGSLWDDPGSELEDATDYRISDVLTPFNIEYARSSSTRGGAPNLVPVDVGGARVSACVLIMRGDLDLVEARDRIYRREIHQIGSRAKYVHSALPKPGHVWLPTTDQVCGVAQTIYTVLEANIPLDERRAESLAPLAVRSVRLAEPREDGITYLEHNLARGIITPLTREYEGAILGITGTRSLAEARAKCLEP